MERGTRRGTDRQRGSNGPERLGGEEGERERAGGISWHAVMYEHQPFSQTTERERGEGRAGERRARERDRREDVERLSLDVLLPLICLNVTDRHTAGL